MVITTEGSDVELMCIFIGTPSPQVTWYKDGQELSNKGFQVTVALNNRCEAILKLSSVMPSVAGNYVCKGSTIAGNIEGNIRLTVEGNSNSAYFYVLLSVPSSTAILAGSSSLDRSLDLSTDNGQLLALL